MCVCVCVCMCVHVCGLSLFDPGHLVVRISHCFLTLLNFKDSCANQHITSFTFGVNIQYRRKYTTDWKTEKLLK